MEETINQEKGQENIVRSRYLTEMEKSPWEFWLARTMKEPTPLFMRMLSASWRDILSSNQLSSGKNQGDKNKEGELN